MYSAVKRLLIGTPLSSSELGEQRLNKRVALAVFGTDAVASTAFATQEILVVLVPAAGMAALDYLVPISIVVIALLAIVTASYRQTLYRLSQRRRLLHREPREPRHGRLAPRGGIVDGRLHAHRCGVDRGRRRRDHLGDPVDRAATASRSVTLLALITVANLPGVRESGRLFAPPTYTYIAIMTLLVVVGLFRVRDGLARPPARRPGRVAHFTGGEAVLGPRPRSCSFTRSRPAQSRSAAWRRSRTGSRHFASPSHATRPSRSRGWHSSSARCSSGSPCSHRIFARR